MGNFGLYCFLLYDTIYIYSVYILYLDIVRELLVRTSHHDMTIYSLVESNIAQFFMIFNSGVSKDNV